jgi:hypothetical protein
VDDPPLGAGLEPTAAGSVARQKPTPNLGEPKIRHPKLVCLFAVAMGILEAIVVVYLRRIYYPDGFGFPLVAMDEAILRTELIREAMTLVMLFCIAWIAAAHIWSRLMAFIVAFGVWDLSYYAGLKLFLGWPGDLLTPDILFLIPTVWVGPVFAPALVAATWVVGGLLLHRARYEELRLGWKEWGAGVVGCAVILSSFLIHVGREDSPGFLWGVFLIGYLLGLSAMVSAFVHYRRGGQGRGERGIF